MQTHKDIIHTQTRRHTDTQTHKHIDVFMGWLQKRQTNLGFSINLRRKKSKGSPGASKYPIYEV